MVKKKHAGTGQVIKYLSLNFKKALPGVKNEENGTYGSKRKKNRHLSAVATCF